MPIKPIVPVVLCGGSGTRLWPVSRKSFPKQFVPLIEGKSLLELTLARLGGLAEQVLCITGEEHRFLVAEAQVASNVSGVQILEPSSKNTAAAMTLAALYAKSQNDSNPLLLFCPADHYIPDAEAFHQTIRNGQAAAEAGSFVTFGIRPTYPSTGYGYIEKGNQNPDGSFQVNRFIEKPDALNAASLILNGKVLWNAGIFLVDADTLLNTIAGYSPDILKVCQMAMQSASKEETTKGCFIRPDPELFKDCRSESIDYAVLEKCPSICVVPFDGAWSDIGSWNAVADFTPVDGDNNRINGQGSVYKSHNTFVHAPHRPVVALGTVDLLIIDTPDALLVANRDHAEQVKDVVSILETKNYSAAVTHRRVARPWGWYDTVDTGLNFQVKRIVVKSKASLSLQKHKYRAEHWVVVKGTAEVTCGDQTFIVTENQSTYIPIGAIHRLSNPNDTELQIIEVQSGSYLGEDDIFRLEDTYGRAIDK